MVKVTWLCQLIYNSNIFCIRYCLINRVAEICLEALQCRTVAPYKRLSARAVVLTIHVYDYITKHVSFNGSVICVKLYRMGHKIAPFWYGTFLVFDALYLQFFYLLA